MDKNKVREAFEIWYESLGKVIPQAGYEHEAMDAAYLAYKFQQQRIAELEKDAERPVPYHKVVEALTLMAWQYLENHDGFIDHQYMSAGEATTEVLEKLGIIQDDLILEKFKEDGYFDEAHEGK